MSKAGACKTNSRKFLKDARLRVTSARLAVLDSLLNAPNPLNQEQIAESLKPNSPDKVTIYRSLEKLVEADVIHLAYIKDRTGYYEPADNCDSRQCHPHFTCKVCKSTICLTQTRLPLLKQVPPGFVLENQKVLLSGICSSCNKEKNT